MPPVESRELRLASRPAGTPTLENFTLVTTTVPDPAEGQVLVRNLYMSVDPYMRGRMNDVPSYVPPFQIGAPLDGGAVGRVVASRAPGVAAGDLVLSRLGWREAFVADARHVSRVDPSVRPPSLYLGALGTTGFTAWVGLQLAGVKAGDRVFVSAAAGATGSMAGQLAKARGAWVVGSAGTPEKVAMLERDLGLDRGISYRDGDLAAKLRAAAPEGIDVYFDNVGGDHLEAALDVLRPFGRVVACGSISRYNDAEPRPGPRNLHYVTTKRLTIRGFIVTDHAAERPAFLAEVQPLVAAGRLVMRETVVDGIERAPQAFLDLLAGKNVGKMIVRLASE